MTENICQCNCGVCEQGYHCFCNQSPHGDAEQAYEYFISHPEVAKSVKPIGEWEQHARALKDLEREEKKCR